MTIRSLSRWIVALILVVCTTGLVASAAHASESGLGVGLRLAYAFPRGDIANDAATGTQGAPLDNELAGQIPLGFDLGYFVTRGLFVGAYFEYGFAQANTDRGFAGICKQPGVSCSGTDVRLGVEATYRFSAGEPVMPWIGLGVGWEWTKLRGEDPTGSAELSFDGLEAVALQAGTEFAVTGGLTIGPYLAFSVGRYSSLSAVGGGINQSAEIPEKATHTWLQAGIKATLGP